MNAIDLTTLDDVRAWLAIKDGNNNDDQLLARLITAASQFVQTWLSRTIAAASYTDTFNGRGVTHVQQQFANYPVTAVSAVTISGIAIPQAAAYSGNGQPTGYFFDQNTLYLRGYCFTKDIQNCVIQYTAGYAAVPYDIAQATIELVALRYRERDRIGQSSKGMAGETTAYTIVDLPKSTQAVLAKYRKVAPI